MQYKKDIVEMVAINLGFVADKYYSSRDKMFRTYKTECLNLCGVNQTL